VKTTTRVMLCAGFAALLAACGSSSSTDAGNDAGGSGGCSPRDAGAACTGGQGDGGTICRVSQCNKLPAAFQSSNPADFGVSNDGGAASYLNGLVEFTAQSTSQGPTDGGSQGCPAGLTYQTYCNGFQANASGGSVLVDTFDYAQSPATCESQDNGATLPSITGIWYDSYGAYTIAIRTCADLGSSSTYAGTGSPPATPQGSQTVAAFIASHPADGATVTVSGVVVGVGVSSDGDITFGLEDPNGGPNASTGVYKAGEAASLAVAPGVGDYVTVTGTWSQSYQNIGL
jgi:hypothetical protein